ncbi:MAG TPA: hypothetical protein VNK67_15580 [Burkholderiales bacterium]|nr:hypothetical protein [Burkholderiales bacterium]
MHDKFRNRVLAFYVAGFLNLVLGLYVLIHGRALVEQTMWYILLFFFFGFAAVDFWFARNLRRKWIEAYQEHLARQQEAKGKGQGGDQG